MLCFHDFCMGKKVCGLDKCISPVCEVSLLVGAELLSFHWVCSYYSESLG